MKTDVILKTEGITDKCRLNGDFKIYYLLNNKFYFIFFNNSSHKCLLNFF
jgi:hypothetical protein